MASITFEPFWFLPPATKLGQGNIFRSVCQEFCPQGGACVAGGMHGGGMHGRGHVWWGHAWQGACMVGRMCGRGGMHATHAPLDIMRYGRSMCRRYASYWNPFLFYLYMCKHWWDLNPWLSVWYNVNSNCLSLTDSGLPVFNKIWHKIMCIRNVIWTTCQYLNIF